jgi:hypothetical protein
MKKNMGTADVVIRIIVAIIFVILFATKTVTGLPGIILVALAAVFVLTSIFQVCPLYMPFKINTGKKE